MKLLKLWLLLTSYSFAAFFVSRLGAILFLTGKILRFLFFLSFLILLVSQTRALYGYTLWQVLLFYLTYNFIDSVTQMLFREVYRFRQQVISGNFDYILVKPVNPLFRILFGGADLLDLLTLIPFIIMLGFVALQIPGISFWRIAMYVLLIVNALFIAASFHIIVVSMAILTTEIDHAIMIYRDFTSIGKLPIHIYAEPLRSLVTFVIPVGIMMTYPVDALNGLLEFKGFVISFLVSVTILILGLVLWRFALKRYTSASS